MDMHKKRELRAKKKQEEENKESQTSVNINWHERIYVPCPSNPYKIRLFS